MSGDWVVDIAKIEPEQRTRYQWARLGAHHAQALVARHLPHMSRDQWMIYQKAIREASRHESKRFGDTIEGAYWSSFLITLDFVAGIEVPKRHFGPGNIRRVV